MAGVYVCGYRCVIQACVHVEGRGQHQIFPLFFLSLFLRQCQWSSAVCHGWLVSFRILLCLSPQSWDYRCTCSTSRLYVDFGNPNSGHHVCKASILPIKPCSQPVSLVSLLEIKLTKSNYSFLPFIPPGF